MMQRLAQLFPFYRNEEPAKGKPGNSGTDSSKNFNALDFYENLEGYKQSVVNTELGENNNANQNLQFSNFENTEEEVKVTKSSNEIGGDVIKLDAKAKLMSEHVPNKLDSRIPFDDSRVYGGQYTSKGNLYYCSSQERIGIYNSYDPYKMKKIKTISALDVHWTITSMDTTEDEEYLVYSTISPILHIVDLQTLCKFHCKIDCIKNDEIANGNSYYSYFGIYNCKFSGDGKELVCVTNNAKIIVYDINKEEKVCNIDNTHNDDINTV
jgi:WD repeat-containing protein 23